LNGKPVLFFHGTPGSRFFRHPDESILFDLEIRLITVDRPGYGRSDPKPGRTYLGWGDDVAQLVDSIKIDRFALGGHSGGGGPHVGACAVAFPERITKIALVSTMGIPLDSPMMVAGKPFMDRLLLKMTKSTPRIYTWITGLAAKMARSNADMFVKQLTSTSPPGDMELLAQPQIRKMGLDNFREAFHQGGGAWARENYLGVRDWGINFEKIELEAHVYHGDKDPSVPVSAGKLLAETLPNSRSYFIQDGGHLIVLSHWEEILRNLIQ
jgi:pimeloyl-ACP methyl ester carboxylesterase